METLSTNPRFDVIWDGCIKVIANGKTNDYDNDRWGRYADADRLTKNELARRNGGKAMPDWAIYNFGRWNIFAVSKDRALAEKIWELTAPARAEKQAKEDEAKRRYDVWESLMPAEIDEWRKQSDAVKDYLAEQNRRFDDENLSSISVGECPKITTKLTDEAKAWLALDNGADATHYAKRDIYRRAKNDVIDGNISLVDAAARADKEWSDKAAELVWNN